MPARWTGRGNAPGRNPAGFVLAAFTLVLASTLTSAGLAGPASVPTILAVPGRANANVSIASSGSFVAAVWSAATSGGTTDIMAAASGDGGVSFGTPVRVNDTAGDARVNGEQPPRLALVPRPGDVPRIAVIWTSKRTEGTTLLTAHSDDGGRTFSAAALVPGTGTVGNRGWEAIGADPKGRVHAVWLDHRRMAAPDASKTTAPHRHGEGGGPGGVPGAAKSDGVAMAQKSDLYFDTLGDPAAPRAIASGVCYCCKTAIAFGTSGDIYLAWRHVYPGNLRDMAFTVSRDGGRTFAVPVRVSQDNWMIEGCPDDGPTMQVDSKGRIHIVWPAVTTDGGGQVKALFHAVSVDGQAFSPRSRIATVGQANHPQLAVTADDSLVLTWDESGSGSRRIIYGRGTLDGSGRAHFTRIALNDEVGVYPIVAAIRAGAVVAWTSGTPDASVIKVARVP